MMHFYRLGQDLRGYQHPSDFDKQEIVLAQQALDAAVPLLPDDPRIPGFRGAATYTNGVLNGNDSLRALGLQQLRDSIPLYAKFNSFSFVGAVAPVVAPDDPLFEEAIGYIEAAIASCNPSVETKICGNEGKAPHNLQGSLVLFGDLYAKAGNLQQALVYYRLAASLSDTATWRFKSIADERIADAAARVALYRDGDRGNDPLLIGAGEEACASCHWK